MMPRRPDGLIRAFGMSGLQIVTGLKKIENEFELDLGFERTTSKNRKITEYQQFEAILRAEATRMSEMYEVFYCLENSIRKLVADIMVEAA